MEERNEEKQHLAQEGASVDESSNHVALRVVGGQAVRCKRPILQLAKDREEMSGERDSSWA